jgi:hypothetical protein
MNIPRGAYPSRAINLHSLAALPIRMQQWLQNSQAVWQAAMRTEVSRAVDAGIKFGAERGVTTTVLDADSQREFAALYAEQAAKRAGDLDGRGFPGSAVLAAAQRIIRERGFNQGMSAA